MTLAGWQASHALHVLLTWAADLGLALRRHRHVSLSAVPFFRTISLLSLILATADEMGGACVKVRCWEVTGLEAEPQAVAPGIILSAQTGCVVTRAPSCAWLLVGLLGAGPAVAGAGGVLSTVQALCCHDRGPRPLTAPSRGWPVPSGPSGRPPGFSPPSHCPHLADRVRWGWGWLFKGSSGVCSFGSLCP